ncbi:MAG: hypothetical protein PWQ43_768 [Rikenellaceae bacterium]|nr:hypothetical protein [Rikenellaceae bacterium]
MKSLKIFLIILNIFMCNSIYSQDFNNTNKKVDTLKIKNISKKLRESYILPSEVYEVYGIYEKKQFFEGFPDSFELFEQIYGYRPPIDTLYTLYFESYNHLNLFCELRNVINKEDYYKKIIKLGIGGYWDADAINYLQHCIDICINENLPLTIKTLKSFTDDEIESFWYFIFDGPLRTKRLPVDIEDIKIIDEHIADLAKRALEKAKKNDENCGY